MRRARKTLAIASLLTFVFISLLHAHSHCGLAIGMKNESSLRIGLAEVDISPQIKQKPVFMAGFGQNRKATKIHDPLMARVIVLKDDTEKIALVSVDLVGLFFESIEAIRKRLPQFDYVLVSSTHNHEGPDTIGLWGPHPFQSGVDPDYLQFVQTQIVRAVQKADANKQPMTAKIGTIAAPELLRDSRKPDVKHDTLTALSFHAPKSKKVSGILVQWNCHPETLGSKNTQISADFVNWTVEQLQKRYQCPVIYFTGAVGGLMTSLGVPIQDENGMPLKDGTFAKTAAYGRLVGKKTEQALSAGKSVTLKPIRILHRTIYLPIDNKLYLAGWQFGVLKRRAYLWRNNVTQPGPAIEQIKKKERYCLQTEIALLRLGDLEIAAIPGEIYPELVLGKVPDPADPAADYPQANVEPAIYEQLRARHRMIVGLANDEVGYIIPKRQWDVKAPFCYNLKRAQYGEVNSLGPETAPLLCGAFKALATAKRLLNNEDSPFGFGGTLLIIQSL